MKGRRPKDPDARQRRHKASTAAVLDAQSADSREAPPLSAKLFGDKTLHPLTRKWWRVIWRSPMAVRWLETDVEGLYLVAILRNAFFHQPTPTLAAEIRQQETRFGLDVLSRRRLDWRIANPQAPAPLEEEPEVPAYVEDDFDPRRVLRAVK